MICPRPITIPHQGQVPCGQCINCRVNLVRNWASRILLEARNHQASLFVTLTYSDEHLPRTSDGLPTLKPRDWTLFMKRLRKRVAPRLLRFFACGEYGSQTWRPHYHAVLFGLSEMECRTVGRFKVHPDVQAAWRLGFTSSGGLNEARAGYVAQYVTKKLTSSSGEWGSRQLQGRHPEFMRASRRPGIGATHVEAIAKALDQAQPGAYDIPTEYIFNGKRWPLSPFIAAKVREELGIPVLKRDRIPTRPYIDPNRFEFVELVTGEGTLGTMTRRVSKREQLAAERESKLHRKAKRKKWEAAL